MPMLLCSCLRISLKDIKVSSIFISQLSEAGKRMVQFCFDFDDMQPSHKICSDNYFRNDYDYLISLLEALFMVISQLVRWLLCFVEVATHTLRSFLERFVVEIKRVSDEKPANQTIQKNFTYWSFKTDNFSIFNLSHRVFVDILMDCCLKGTLSHDIMDQVLGDESMHMWIARPGLTDCRPLLTIFC
ncbi:hypothetical protein RF11_10445 [Thelohanellus kitauei]|uniref:Uncharacterized protein n=1 Tax=Thelohanellus kitauei TaxID=669202 RepID=A0A0C2N6B9_THEKT|nr:hypothetical protein RF11_10445 [Thelohanellus kitauei]